jgi:UPF0755 protein
VLVPIKKLFLTALVVLLAGAGYLAWYLVMPVSTDKLPAEFELLPGARLRSAILTMKQAGIDPGAMRFELLARALGRAQRIKAGSYELNHAPTPLQLLRKLTQGDVTQTELTLIEGWHIRQVRAALDSHPFLRHDTAGMDDGQLLARIGATQNHPEGLFFPDTYLFAKGSSDVAVLRRAYRAMMRHLDEEWQKREPGLPYRDIYEALIMASIVEKETGQAGERDMIAGALTNRLRIGMRLQVDPTVIYGLGPGFDGNLKKAHLLSDGPYNSYTRAGLPPTPIAIAGLESLRAALHPAKTDALYYVARGDGSSHFSKTLAEHNQAVTKYQLSGRRSGR